MRITVITTLVLVSAVAAGAKDEERLKKRFGPLYAKFGQGSTTKVTVTSDPVAVRMRNGRVPGRRWMATDGKYVFKLTIHDETGYKLERLIEILEKLPAPYMRACTAVSDDGEDGVAVYADLGGAAAHGGKGYINIAPHANALTIAHEAGHTLEQVARELDPEILDKWEEAIKADKISVSAYGDNVRHEDQAEFAQVYAVCLDAGAGKLAELKRLSPARFALWEKMLEPPEHDYYRHLRYPNKLVASAGRNRVEQEGGANAVGYRRRTVKWWPRKGQDVIGVPECAPLRVWTRNKGQENRQALAGVCRNWTASAPETFKAHLIAFRAFGTSTVDPDPRVNQVRIPCAVLRMEDGTPRAFINYGPASQMLSKEDHAFIHKTWEAAYPKLYATTSREDRPMPDRPPGGVKAKIPLKPWEAARPKFNGIETPAGEAKYPQWGWHNDELAFETPNSHIIARPEVWGNPANWIRPDNVERQNLYRKDVLEFVENFWTYVEAAGASMPYWRRPGPNYKYVIHVHDHRAAGGWGHCGIGDCSPHILGHEFFHGQPMGRWDGHYAETMCNAGQHATVPGELQMFNGNFRYPWRNVNTMAYQSSLWCFVLGDNPNWGYGIPIVAGCLASPVESTPYHTIARLGQKKGLWKNGIRGFGDFFGEYAARMVTCDFVEQHMVRSKYGMPELSCLYPVYGRTNCYRINNAEAPRWCGFNIVRLRVAEDTREIAVDFHGIHDAALHSDWRACIVAVDAAGRARYSPLWNKGPMRFALEPSDRHLWLTVAATPSAFPIHAPRRRGPSCRDMYLTGHHAPRYPWEVTLTGCEPGLPHRRQGDVINYDELYGRCDSGNTYLNYSVKHEIPIPLTDEGGPLAAKKLAAMLPRIEAATEALGQKIETGLFGEGWWESKKAMMLGDLTRRVTFLQINAKGRRHPNGGGFVADNAHVDSTAYVGPNAMVLDAARVRDRACIKGSAVVLGPQAVIEGHAKVGGRAWVTGNLTVGGNARILEAATVTTILRTPRTPSVRHEGQAHITGNVVIKGEPFLHLCYATNQTLTGGVVMDYTPTVANRESGVFRYGRFYRETHRSAPSLRSGVDAGALYANWQFNQPKTVLLEDSYVNNNGILHGEPEFVVDGEHRCIVFNGKNQYAEAPPSVADFGELTIDTLVHLSADGGGCLFDFGTGEDDCFYLAIEAPGKPVLTTRHQDKSHRIAASEGVPADRWVRVRVEMDGTTASIYVDGKQVAREACTFRPRMVFIGDRAEGNFIARGRLGDSFFKGRMDHFRIYRKVHDGFNAVPPVPFSLTQIQEWSEEDQLCHDRWEGRRKAKETQLKAGAYGRMLEDIKRLEEQKSAVLRTAKLEELTARAGEAEAARKALIRKLQAKAKDAWEAALREAGLFGRNPYPGKDHAALSRAQQEVVYHTSADWDDKVLDDHGVREDKSTPKMREWLTDVRGY